MRMPYPSPADEEKYGIFNCFALACIVLGVIAIDCWFVSLVIKFFCWLFG